MKVIDAHVHLDERAPSAAAAVEQLDAELAAADVAGAVVLHLALQPWSVADVMNACRGRARLVPFVNVVPGEHAVDELERALRLGYRGLKLHPRLQHYGVDAPATVELVAAAGDAGVPVVIDAFPDGDWLLDGFDPLAFGRLGRSCPQTRIVIAHFGGHHCLDVLMIAKRVPNLWADISYSFLYYRGSRVPADLVYACRSMRFERVLYGSDHPDRPLGIALDASVSLLREHGVHDDDMDRLLYRNAAELLQWPTG